MAREKHVTPITVEEKQAIIKDSVQTLSNKPVMSGEDLKKQFVSPIVNVDGRANIGDVVSRIANETEAALDEIDGIASKAAQTAQNTYDALGQALTTQTARDFAQDKKISSLETSSQEQADKIAQVESSKQDNLVIDGGYSESNPVATVQTVDNKLAPITQDIPLLGATLSMSVDPLTYVLTVELKNKNGEVVSTVNSDLPLEEMVVAARLGDDEKTIVLELKNGNSVSFSVAALVDGLISKETFETALAKKADKLSGANVLLGTDENGNQKEYPANSVGTNVYVDGERVETFNADEKADKETTETALEERVKTETVGVAGGVAGLDEQGKVPKSQLPASSLGLELGETYDTAFAGNRGAKLEKRVNTLYSFHEEAGDIIVAPIDTAFNERTTADGENVVTNSIAVVKKVEGGTVAVGKDENGLNGTLVNASFKGIESKDAESNVISTLEFPESVPTPLGTTIDFENKKITNYGVEIVFTEEYINNLTIMPISAGFVLRNILLNEENTANGVATIDYPVGGSKLPRITVGLPTYPTSILLQGFNVAEIAGTTIAECKEWLLNMAQNGTPLTIRYVSSTLQSETPFTEEQLSVGDNYIVAPQGTETVLGNDTEAENKPTIEYVIKAGE